MVVVLAPAVNRIFESLTHNPLTRAQRKNTLLSIVGIHKECIANARKFESDFVGRQHGCTRVDMGK